MQRCLALGRAHVHQRGRHEQQPVEQRAAEARAPTRQRDRLALRPAVGRGPECGRV